MPDVAEHSPATAAPGLLARRVLLPVVVVLVTALAWLSGRTDAPPVLAAGLPEFSVPDLLEPGRDLHTADLRGRAVLLNVWATWCVPCRQEHDMLMAIARRGELPVVGIDWRDGRADALRWLDRLGNPYRRVGFDADGAAGAALGVKGAPESLLIAADGRVLYRHVGPLTEDAWALHFRPLLDAARGPS